MKDFSKKFEYILKKYYLCTVVEAFMHIYTLRH
jgi:hypothetical protein